MGAERREILPEMRCGEGDDDVRYIREALLIPYYDAHPEYVSPISGLGEEFVKEMLRFAGIIPKTALDVGCGDGRLALILKERYGTYTQGIEVSKVRAQIAVNENRCGVYVGDLYEILERLGVDNYHRYDLIFFVDVLEHLAAPWEAVKLARKLGPVVGTSPLALPMEEHLQVWADEEAVREALEPDRVAVARLFKEAETVFAFWGHDDG